MTQTKTDIGIKELNKKKIFEFIYTSGETSKQEMADTLGLSLPTVTNNLNTLINEGLVEKCGRYESTGGRKAHIISCVKTARFAVGVSAFMSSVRICAVDLYGTPFAEIMNELTYHEDESYYIEVADMIKSFVASLPYPDTNCIGVGISTQGLVSQDGNNVVYSAIMGNAEMTRDKFGRHLPWPCILEHDTKASATAEIWKSKNETEDAIYLLLNNNFGGVLVSRGKVHSGGSGVIEHVIIHPDGMKCYCGKKGCVEAYCSANALKKKAGMSLELFFKKLRGNDSNAMKIWKDFLDDLALTIDNLRMIINYKIIIGGLLRQYMTQSDINMLEEAIMSKTAFRSIGISIELSRYGQNAAAIGAALHYINSFLSTVC